MDRSVIRGNLAGVICMIVWSLHFPLSVAILNTWDPLALAPVRMGLAGITVAMAGLLSGQAGAMLALARNSRFVLVSFVFGLSGLFFIIGQSRVDAVSAAVIVSSMPIFSALMGWLEGQERPGLKLMLAIGLTVAGGVLTSTVSAQGSGVAGSLSGILFTLAGVIAYVWYTRQLVVAFVDTPDMSKVAVSMLVSVIPCSVILAFFAAAGTTIEADFSLATLGLIVTMAGMSVGLSSVLWLWTGRVVGVTVAAMHHNMVPFYVIVMAALGGAIVTGQHMAGAVLVISGAVLAQLRSRNRKIGMTQPVAPGRENPEAK
ncbi:EamA family transporter [Anderseniella sp. Alg231-50]|uniref:EamA family transporter n=1 Tax=Anderseniella sp. Alg231-50 TaxID=1922226 RepID=UPI000D55A2E1